MRALILRISIIVAAGLAGITIASMVAFQFERGADARRGNVRLPPAQQVAAIADLIEMSAPEALPTVLRALNFGPQRVVVADTPPAENDMRPVPGNTLFLGPYAQALGGRPVQALMQRDPGPPRPGPGPSLRIER